MNNAFVNRDEVECGKITAVYHVPIDIAKNKMITYNYNENEIRTQKTVNGTTSIYYLEGSKVIYEQTGENITYYTYDENGQIIGINYNNTQYYYIKNAQNDIVGILDSSLKQIVSYEYDSWGKVISIKDAYGNNITSSSHIGKINPYRYRSYRYDEETGLYYLNSRYYNPEWGRFINADGQFNNTILGNNLYAYCENNPVNMIDDNGYFSISVLIKTVVSVAQKVVSKIATSVKTNNDRIISSATVQNNTNTSTSINLNDNKTNNFVLSNRKPGKTPPGKWPTLPKNLGGKKPIWNPRGYYNGKYGETTWDSRSHGSGIDRGNGAQDGHWDTETGGRFNREGGQIIAAGLGLGLAGYGMYTVAKWMVAIGGAPATGGGSLVLFAIP